MKSKRRGISELIATLLLLMITTSGSVFLAFIVQGSGLGSTDTNTLTLTSPTYSIMLTGYDTRDGEDLLGIATLDNEFDKKLCTTNCQTAPDDIPSDDGTEFIALQIKNVSPNTVHIQRIQVNGISHVWDQQTGGVALDASSSAPLSGKYPTNGKFSILSTSTLIQKSDNKLFSDEEVRLVVKLSGDIGSDVLLSKPLPVHINFGGQKSTELVLMSGDAR